LSASVTEDEPDWPGTIEALLRSARTGYEEAQSMSDELQASFREGQASGFFWSARVIAAVAGLPFVFGTFESFVAAWARARAPWWQRLLLAAKVRGQG
jgi:hypothetical protein